MEPLEGMEMMPVAQLSRLEARLWGLLPQQGQHVLPGFLLLKGCTIA